MILNMKTDPWWNYIVHIQVLRGPPWSDSCAGSSPELHKEGNLQGEIGQNVFFAAKIRSHLTLDMWCRLVCKLNLLKTCMVKTAETLPLHPVKATARKYTGTVETLHTHVGVLNYCGCKHYRPTLMSVSCDLVSNQSKLRSVTASSV